MTTEETNIEIDTELLPKVESKPKEMSITDMVSYLVEKLNSIHQLLASLDFRLGEEKEEVVEEEIDSLDGIIYKLKLFPIKKEDKMVSIGTVNELGIVELYPTETQAPIIPSLYDLDFYYIGIEPLSQKNLSNRYLSDNTPKANFKKFTPKKIINQVIMTKDNITYTTGYINENGVAIYYDQLIKH